MHKVRGSIAPNNSAKKTRLLHRCNLALLGLVLCTTLLAGARSTQEPTQDPVKRIEVLSYEGQPVSSVELAGQPELNLDELSPLVEQKGGEDFSIAKIDQTIASLQRTGKFKDVQLDLRPEQDGVRVIFILQPAIYFGMYHFPGAEEFTYARLLQVVNYIQQEPYSALDIRKSKDSLLTFLQRNGYFQAEVNPEVQIDNTYGLANVNFHVKLNEVAKFGDIIIEGTTPDETEHLKGSLRSLRARLKSSAIREGRDYSLKTIQNALSFLESHLQSENHLGAEVRLIGANYNPQTNRADISFNILPGPIVHARVEGTRLLPWTRRRLLPVYQQNGLAPELLQEGRQNLLQRYRQRGFFDVQVEMDTTVRPDGVTILYTVNKGPRKSIEDVAFNGNDHFDKDVLKKHVQVEKAGLFSRGSYDESSIKTLQAFYQSKGFNEVKVTPQFNTEDNDVVITFAVREGPQDTVETFRMEGNTSVPTVRLAPDGLRLSAGQPYAQKSIDDDRNKIMSHYLEQGYLTANFRAKATPAPNDPHKFQVVYQIHEGPQVKASSVVMIGQKITKEALLARETETVQVGKPLSERVILESESQLYTTGIFDWAEVNPRRQVTSQEQEDVIVKVHESKRNTILYGLGFEMVSRGGNVPVGTIALPGLPTFAVPDTFQITQRNVKGPRANFQYTRNNVRGKAETVSFAALYGPLDRRASFVFTDPNFRWTSWTASLSGTGENNRENPIFTTRQGEFSFQLQKPINAKKTQTLFLRYTLTRSTLLDLVIPELVPPEDLHTRLSTLAGVWIRDTRNNPLDASTGMYDSVELDLNPAFLGSNANFARLMGQAAIYRTLKGGVVWANSLRAGLLQATSSSHVPLGQKFFTGGGSTLRGFPLNGAGPQHTIPACSDPANPATCTKIRVPSGGTELYILNTEVRIPLPTIRLPLFPALKGLSFATFYDGGNVFEPVGLSDFPAKISHSVGVGFRYATPVGPIRIDVGRNLTPIPGIKATQIFITLGQAF